MALLSDASCWPEWYPGMTEPNIAAPFPEEGSDDPLNQRS
jgi:hypothetical protein